MRPSDKIRRQNEIDRAKLLEAILMDSYRSNPYLGIKARLEFAVNDLLRVEDPLREEYWSIPASATCPMHGFTFHTHNGDCGKCYHKKFFSEWYPMKYGKKDVPDNPKETDQNRWDNPQ